MPSSYSTERSELCHHVALGSVAFLADNTVSDSTAQSISQATTEEERRKLEQEEKKEKARHVSVMDWLSTSRKRMDKVAADVRTICAETEPHTLAQAFEKDAAA
ncbi:hypothetical protein KCU78_g6594, partial [Aureobasidium melanogenum]